MPMDRSRYPKDWDAIAHRIKEAAGWSCQSCGRPCRRPGESVFDFIDRIHADHPTWVRDLVREEQTEEFGVMEAVTPGRFTLTVAHLDHDPENPNARLAAWCSVCHCRYDLKAMATKRRLKQEREGQMTLFSAQLQPGEVG